MKLQEALELGNAIGLGTHAECVNNVILHVGNLFAYTEAEREVTELLKEAADAGIKFCASCGSAMKADGTCYMAQFTHRDPI